MALDKQQLDALRIDPEQRSAGRGLGRWLTWALALAVVGMAAYIIFAPKLRPAGGASTANSIETALAQSPRAADAAVLDASGYVVARRLATVSSKVTGRIDAVFIEEGMSVAAGDVLARLDDSSIRVQMDLVLSQLESARRGVSETQVRLAEAQRQLQRTNRLIADKLVSEAALDSAQAEVDALRARLSAARSSVDVAQRTVALRQQELADLQIRAPFDGVVVAKNAQPGEMISPVSAGGGFTRTGIGTIVDMGSLEIEVDVNEAFINRVEAGQRVIAKLDAYKDWEIPASVINIVPTADRQRATVKVRIAFETLDPRILPDMGVKVRFLDTEKADTEQPPLKASIPTAALRQDDSGQEFVWLVRNGVLERRAVKSAATGRGLNTDIIAGLAPGDQVVTESTVELKAGLSVGET